MAGSSDQLNEQLALWEKAATSSDSQLTINYLEKYPSGFYAELAEAHLNILLAKKGEKKLIIRNSKDNPYSKGTIQARESHYVGDTYTIEERDLITKVVIRTFKQTVTSVEPNQVVFNNGRTITDLLGNDIKSGNSRFLTPTQYYPAVYQVGHRWSTEYWWAREDGKKSLNYEELKIKDRVEIETKAGRFNAYFIVTDGKDDFGNSFIKKFWVDPEKCKRAIRHETFAKNTRGHGIHAAKEWEMVSFSEKSS